MPKTETTLAALPPIEQCEILFIPSRRAPVIVWPEPGQTPEQMMAAVIKHYRISRFHRIVFALGEMKDRYYAVFTKAVVDHNLQTASG